MTKITWYTHSSMHVMCAAVQTSLSAENVKWTEELKSLFLACTLLGIKLTRILRQLHMELSLDCNNQSATLQNYGGISSAPVEVQVAMANCFSLANNPEEALKMLTQLIAKWAPHTCPYIHTSLAYRLCVYLTPCTCNARTWALAPASYPG